MKKFELTGEATIVAGVAFRRIRALIDIPAFGVKAGDLGGWVEKEAAIDQSGDAWVSGDARVYGDAWVYGNAWVYGDARVYGNARCLLIAGSLGSRNATITVTADAKIGVRFSTGCFSGTKKQLLDSVNQTHGDGPHAQAYRAFVALADLLVDPAKPEGEPL